MVFGVSSVVSFLVVVFLLNLLPGNVVFELEDVLET
jgi:hypothetical protein